MAATTKRRVSPLARERARERMLALPAEERAARLAAMQEGRKRARARRPERLAEVEARLDDLGAEIRLAETFEERHAIRCEMRDLGQERMRLLWGGGD